MNETDTVMSVLLKISNIVLYYKQRIKGYMCQRCQILYCTMSKGSKTMYVKGVKSSSNTL